MLPQAARNHYRRLQRVKSLLLISTRRIWERMEPTARWEEQYREEVAPQLTAMVVAAQIAATRESDTYVADVLQELALGPVTEPGVLVPTGIAGWAGDGRQVSTLLEGAVVQAGQAYGRLRDDAIGAALRFEPDIPDLDQLAAEALTEAGEWLDMVVATVMADTARAAEAAAIAPRDWVDGYVRMLNPPSCSRCAVLAGRFYLWNDGFERHPLCDCVHIPASEKDSADLRVNPDRYFESLPTAAELASEHPDMTVQMRREAGLVSQEDIFTEAGARAVRDGADLGQVVNARRGMETAQQNPRGWIPKGRLVRSEVFGRGVFITTEGVTKRGRGRKAMGVGRPVRLMPESIYEIAEDRADAVRLLKLYGFIL